MYIHRDESKHIARAPAKLNLFLEVGQRRSDGFHELETLIVPVRIWDSLTLAVKPPTSDGPGRIELKVRHAGCGLVPTNCDQVPTGPDNLVCRALTLLQQRSGSRFGAQVELVKRIPSAAGMGGGSSDAAVALRLACRAWNLNWPRSRLMELAAELGSDVPFFLAGAPAICRGRGERIEPFFGLRSLHVVVVKPPFGLSTRAVYEAHDALRDTGTPSTKSVRAVGTSLARGQWGSPRHWMYNRLQSAAATLTPWIRRISMLFDRLDFVAHQLTGSGSAYFGVCRHAQHARRLATILRARQLGLVYATRSCQ
jgi:4-diphosphocytidyl-2-C-methyl-D-erythritol kinase